MTDAEKRAWVAGWGEGATAIAALMCKDKYAYEKLYLPMVHEWFEMRREVNPDSPD